MNRRITSALTQLLMLLLSWPLGFAQGTAPLQPNTAMPTQSMPRESQPAFTQPELDQMLAPIALYPDSLLSQILMASTYPLEVIEAARWSKANPNLKGDQAVQAVAQMAWDPSVKSLVAFPQILTVMDDKLSWMEQLGEAFLAQQSQVMDTIQMLRQKASNAGNLSSNDQIRVDQQGQSIVIVPANPQVIYVPYYDPMVMYGPWWWPMYPPIYWAPWSGYFIGSGFGVGFAWGIGIGIGQGFFFGGFNWPHHNVVLNRGGFWTHDPDHRRGVTYRDLALRQQFGRMGASHGMRDEFRGHEPTLSGRRSALGNHPETHNGISNRLDAHGSSHDLSRESTGGRVEILRGTSRSNEPSRIRPPSEAQLPLGNRPEVRNGIGNRSVERGSLPGFSREPIGGRTDIRISPSRSNESNWVRPHNEAPPHVFEGISHGAAERGFGARGQTSSQGFVSRPSGGGIQGGGGGGHHR